MKGLEGPFLGKPQRASGYPHSLGYAQMSPLSADLQQKIKEIGQNAKVVADRVRKFVCSIINSTRHVGEQGPRGCPHPQHPLPSFQSIPISNAHSLPTGRALRNVWLWLAKAGYICNRDLGSPHSSCMRYMDKAKDRCERALPLLFHICYLVHGFKVLCTMMSTCESWSLLPWGANGVMEPPIMGAQA